MNRRKPVAGVCGRCGRPVVQPTADELARRAGIGSGLDYAWVNGHHYVLGELEMVRCFQHEPDERPELWGMPTCE